MVGDKLHDCDNAVPDNGIGGFTIPPPLSSLVHHLPPVVRFPLTMHPISQLLLFSLHHSPPWTERLQIDVVPVPSGPLRKYQ